MSNSNLGSKNNATNKPIQNAHKNLNPPKHSPNFGSENDSIHSGIRPGNVSAKTQPTTTATKSRPDTTILEKLQQLQLQKQKQQSKTPISLNSQQNLIKQVNMISQVNNLPFNSDMNEDQNKVQSFGGGFFIPSNNQKISSGRTNSTSAISNQKPQQRAEAILNKTNYLQLIQPMPPLYKNVSMLTLRRDPNKNNLADYGKFNLLVAPPTPQSGIFKF